MKPVYAEASESDRLDAWLERNGQRVPLKLVIDELEPVVLPGAPTTGAAGKTAREIAERLEDAISGAENSLALGGTSLEGGGPTSAHRAVTVAAAAARPYLAALDRVGPALAAAEGAARPALEAFDRMAPAIAAAEAARTYVEAVARIAPADGPRPLTDDELEALDRRGLVLPRTTNK